MRRVYALMGVALVILALTHAPAEAQQGNIEYVGMSELDAATPARVEDVRTIKATYEQTPEWRAAMEIAERVLKPLPVKHRRG